MSDVKGIEITDVIGLSDPITKLVETISGGIGKLYEPTHIRKIAKAKAEEIKLLSDAISDAGPIAIIFENNGLHIDTTNISEMYNRAQSRLVFQELKKQNNIDNVVRYAAIELAEKDTVAEEPVDIDWATRFFDSISDISSDEMQLIWGKILAGEIETPGSFSFRTIDAVRNMNKKEAELFVAIAPFLINYQGEYFIPSRNELMNKYGLSYGMILALDECGLVNSSGTLTLTIPLEKEEAILYNGERVAFIGTNDENIKEFSLGVHNLTRVGKEILQIIEEKPNNNYFIEFVNNEISKKNIGIVTRVHVVEEIEKGRIKFNNTPLDIG